MDWSFPKKEYMCAAVIGVGEPGLLRDAIQNSICCI